MRIEQQYRDRTRRSREHFVRASRQLPGGATRSLNAWPPHPVYITGGERNTLTDLDGNRYTDFLGNYTALPLGYTNDAVVAAVRDRMLGGSVYSFSGDLEAVLAERLTSRLPSIERLRFTGSGTEAVMFALRLARAATGRTKIAKAEGGYHGTIDDVMVSNRPPADLAGPEHAPSSVAEMRGIPTSRVADTVIVPFNDTAGSEAVVRSHAGELAAVILEPMLGVGGMIPAEPSYLRRMRELCSELGIILIFDEVITLRLAEGGAQSIYGIRPDLTVMGKIIGGGLPIGAYGGRADLMAFLEPGSGTDVYDSRSGGPALYQGGTFTGNSLSLCAGIAALDQLDAETLSHLNALGDSLRGHLNARLEDAALPACVTGAGSLFNVHLGPRSVSRFRDVRAVDAKAQHSFFLAMLNRGLLLAARGMGCLSTVHSNAEVAAFVDGAVEAVAEVMSERGLLINS